MTTYFKLWNCQREIDKVSDCLISLEQMESLL